MVTIDSALVQRVAGLAGLEWSAAESVAAQTYLGRFLDYVEDLNALPPTAAGPGDFDELGATALERADVLLPSLPPEAVIANAALTEGSAFQVPRIID